MAVVRVFLILLVMERKYQVEMAALQLLILMGLEQLSLHQAAQEALLVGKER